MSLLLFRTEFPVQHREATIRAINSDPQMIASAVDVLNWVDGYRWRSPNLGYNPRGIYSSRAPAEETIPRLGEAVEENHVIGIRLDTQAELNWTREKEHLLAQLSTLWEAQGWPGTYCDLRLQYRNTWEYIPRGEYRSAAQAWLSRARNTQAPLLAIRGPYGYLYNSSRRPLSVVGGLHRLERA